MADFLKKKSVALLLILAILFTFTPTHVAHAGGGMATVFSVVATVVVIAAMVEFPPLSSLMPAVGGGFFAVPLYTTAEIIAAGSVIGGLMVSGVACAEGLICSSGTSGGVPVGVVASSAGGCNYAQKVTLYIPNLNANNTYCSSNTNGDMNCQPSPVDESNRKIVFYRFTIPADSSQSTLNSWFINDIKNEVGGGWLGNVVPSTWNVWNLPSNNGYHSSSSDSPPYASGLVSNFCSGNVCTLLDEAVPGNSYVAYVAKVIGDYSYPDPNIECPNFYESGSVCRAKSNPNKFLNTDNATSVSFPGTTIGNAISGPLKTGTPTCPAAGACDTTHFNCATPTGSTDNVDSASAYTWTCPGTNGGNDALCIEGKSTITASSSCAIPWGAVIADGDSVTAYQSPAVTPSESCTSQTRTCTSGVLSGTYANQRCITTVGPFGSLLLSPASCTIASGASTCSTVYATWTTLNVPSTRLVNNNTGTTLSTLTANAYPGLQVWVAYPRTVFSLRSGNTILDTQTVTANCAANDEWDTNSGKCIPSVFYSSAATNTPATANSSSATAPCTTPWGQTIRNGASVWAFLVRAITYPAACPSPQVRKCTNGTLSGTYTNPTCTVINPYAVLSVSPTRVQTGSTATVTWTLAEVSGCIINKNGAAWKSDLSSSGSSVETITRQTTYSISGCRNILDEVIPTQSVIVNVIGGLQEF